MSWTQIRVECALKELDTVTAVMSMIDNGLMIEDYSDVTEGMNAIYGELLDEEIINKDKTRAAVSIYLSEDRSVPETLMLIKSRFDALKVEVKIETIGLKEEDWANCWKKYYKPIHIGEKVVIVPMWEEYEAEADEVTVKMDPGMAFGTGTHETTALCAEMIEKYMPKGVRALDVGTGSGILAILESKLGAGAVEALDIDHNAVKVAKENCEANGVSNVVCKQSDLIAEAQGIYGFISANIVADIIIRMAGNVGNYMVPGGILVVSGIIEPQAEQVISVFKSSGFALKDKIDKNDWNAFAFVKL
ncbi:MAG: 50S ribosomal protein L11 methyltransferase [Clostridia bacterium]|nr:50S ribosomal protein L11 methyltransferase [Clostridia bacterium]